MLFNSIVSIVNIVHQQTFASFLSFAFSLSAHFTHKTFFILSTRESFKLIYKLRMETADEAATEAREVNIETNCSRAI